MKITHFTDTHFRLKSPRARKKGYFNQLKDKVKSIFDSESDSDFFVITGDISDTSHWSEKLYREIAEIFKYVNTEIIIISGNHDTQGKISNDDFWLKNLQVIENVTFLKDSDLYGGYFSNEDSLININFYAKSFRHDRDGDISQFNDVELVGPDNAINIGLHHTYVLEDESPFIDSVHINNVLEESPMDVILNGHYHEPLVKEGKGTIYINPGSLARGVCNESNKGRIPEYSVIEISDESEINYELKEVPEAKPWDEVVHNFYETNKQKTVKEDKIKETIDSIQESKKENKKSPLINNFKEICKKQDHEDLIELGSSLIEKAEEDLK